MINSKISSIFSNFSSISHWTDNWKEELMRKVNDKQQHENGFMVLTNDLTNLIPALAFASQGQKWKERK